MADSPRIAKRFAAYSLSLVLGAAAVAADAGAIEPAIATATSDLTIPQWSQLVWDSAKRGDRATFEQFVRAIPTDGANPEAARVRDSFAQFQANEASAASKRAAGRQEAEAKLREHAAAGKLSQALVEVVKIQSFSDDFSEALQIPDVQTLVDQAVTGVDRAVTDGDWLFAQELLYRLRTLYEDTNDSERYQTWKEQLEEVNHRVMLMAEYAPRQLFDLQVKQAERFGDESIGEFNPAIAEDWKERIEGVDHKVLYAALQKAAAEHIEDDGWRPLLVGGLKALRTFVTTPALAETFPTLNDEQSVRSWVQFIDTRLSQAEDAASSDAELRRVSREFVYQDVPRLNDQTVRLPLSVIYREFGDGAMEMLDEYSEIIWPYKLRRFAQSTQGHFIGVGILIRHDDKREIVVVNPLEGTPAYFAGVKPDDRIVQVDGQSTVGWSLNDAVDKITGAEGTKVTLGLRRADEAELITLEVVRQIIKIHSVKGWWKDRLDEQGDPEWDWFIDSVTRVAYVKLTEFNEDTTGDLVEAWREISRQGRPAGLILDLRFNPGGLLSTAVSVSNMFVADGLIVKGEDRNQHEQWSHPAQPNLAAIAEAGVPTVVLINKGSASASEIVAGCLQAHGKAIIIGERSYGKGSVQTVHQIADESLMKLTTQYYRLPAPNGAGEGRLVHKRPGAKMWGVDPDLVVPMTPEQIIEGIELRQAADLIENNRTGAKPRPDINDLLTKGLDPQLETALLLLQVRALGDSDTRHARLN